MKISKLLPWDIRITKSGAMLIGFPIHCIIATYYLVVNGPMWPWLVYSITMYVCTALYMSLIFSAGPPLWTMFIGTKVHFTEPNRLVQAHIAVGENGWIWQKDVWEATVIDGKQMTMLFRKRDHALLTKLTA